MNWQQSITLRPIRAALIIVMGAAGACVPGFAQTHSVDGTEAQVVVSPSDAPKHDISDISGDWQGTLQLSGGGTQPGRTLRIVLKITKAPDGSWSALNYSIDQSSQPMKTTEVTLQGRAFKYSIPSIGGSYEGQLSTDGNSIAGNWARTTPLVFLRATKETAWEIPAPPPPRKPMTEPNPSFEVATIKPSNPEVPGKYFRVVGRTYTTHGTSLADLIQITYGLHPKQIEGGPAWVHDEKFDLFGTPDAEGEPNGKQWLLMIQKLLTGRFGLAFHHEQRELSTYVLSVEKGGPKNFTPSESSNPLPQGLEFLRVPGGLLLPAKNTTMAQFAQMMQQVVLDRPMIDRTGMTGKFDFQLTFMPDESQFDGHPPIAPSQNDAAPAPSLYEAVQQQLGLKITVEKVPTDVLVIDSAHQPSPN